MKLCPQCEFIYEDDQSVCDMDGKELVYDRGVLFQENIPATSPELHQRAETPVRLTVPIPASQPGRWHFRGSAVAALAALIFVALLFLFYFARAHQARSASANQAPSQTAIQSSNQATQVATAAQESTPDFALPPAAALSPSPEPSLPATTSSPSSLSSSPTSYNRGRMLSNPVSAGASGAGSRGPVIVWLTNGSSINADEAWEKREGIWYRQGGVVTFLKRRQVRSIQRFDASGAYAKSTSINRQPETAIAQNQSRIYKPDAAATKKDSRVGSFLKKTGRILKKPFKF